MERNRLPDKESDFDEMFIYIRGAVTDFFVPTLCR